MRLCGDKRPYTRPVDIGTDNPVGRVPDSSTMCVAALSLNPQGWRLGRRRGRWDGSLLDRLGNLDNVHELRVAGTGGQESSAEVANFLQSAIARGTFVSGHLGGEVEQRLPVTVREAIRPSGESVAGDLSWDVASVRQRRSVLRPLMPRWPSVSLVLVSRRAELVSAMVTCLAGMDYPDLEIVVGLHGVQAPAGLKEAAGGRVLVVREFGATEVFGSVVDQAFGCASGELVGKVDDDDYVSDAHLTDLVMAHTYSGATLVGKSTTVVFLEALDSTVRRLFGVRETFTHRVAGATFLLSADDLAEVGGWAPVPRAVDTELINRIRRKEGTIYQPHDIGYLYVRRADPSGHTWGTDIDRFLRNVREQWIGLLNHPEFGTGEPS